MNTVNKYLLILIVFVFFLIAIHSMQGWTATMRHEKEAQKDLSIHEICLERTSS